MPNLIRSAVVASVFASAALFTFSSSMQAQINAFFVYFSPSALKTWLEQSNVDVKLSDQALEIKFPDANRSVRVETFDYTTASGNEKVIGLGPFLSKVALDSGLPVKLEGWNSLRAQIGKSNIQLQLPPYYAYAEMLGPILTKLEYKGLPVDNGAYCEHTLNTSDPPKTVYALLSSHPIDVSESADAPKQRFNLYDLAAVSDTGELSFRIPGKTLEFTKDVSLLKQPIKAGNQEKAVLLRLTGQVNPNLGFEVAMPKEASTQGQNCEWFGGSSR